MNYIELTIYVVLPEPTAFHGVVERQAIVTFKGHPRVVVPLAQMLQGAAQVLGSRVVEGQPEAKISPENTSLSTEEVAEENHTLLPPEPSKVGVLDIGDEK